jgi:uncharacterized membrane protein
MNTRLLIASAFAAAAMTGAAVVQAASPAAPAAPAAPGAAGAAPAAPVPLTPAQVRAGITELGKPTPKPAFMAEKCYGIATAGLNDCGSRPAHSCAGLAKADRDPFSWIYVPVGYCERLAGGKTTAPQA